MSWVRVFFGSISNPSKISSSKSVGVSNPPLNSSPQCRPLFCTSFSYFEMIFIMKRSQITQMKWEVGSRGKEIFKWSIASGFAIIPGFTGIELQRKLQYLPYLHCTRRKRPNLSHENDHINTLHLSYVYVCQWSPLFFSVGWPHSHMYLIKSHIIFSSICVLIIICKNTLNRKGIRFN